VEWVEAVLEEVVLETAITHSEEELVDLAEVASEEATSNSSEVIFSWKHHESF